MIATYSAGMSGGENRGAALDLEDLFLFAFQDRVDLADRGVRRLLQLGLAMVLLVRAGLALLLQLAEVVHDVAADVPDRHAALLGDLVNDFDQLLAALLGELGDLQP